MIEKKAGCNDTKGAILSMQPSLYLLRATPIGEQVPFEVSKEVSGNIQPLCSTTPYCPDERIPRLHGKRQIEGGEDRIQTVLQYEPNPNWEGVTNCPYHFQTKEECYRDINIQAMKQALFTPEEMIQMRNFLESIDFEVEIECILESEIDGTRILDVHGPIYNFHETRFEIGPGNVHLFMIRNPLKRPN
ncbi:MAG: hypothetical protein QF752_16520 [Planctomycetota bacterium]|jgi:hypothetical protein|nr:hypothetical protein [Planctomycetota bacterium]